MFSGLIKRIKRATVGERIAAIGEADGAFGATAGVDVRRSSDDATYVTVRVTSSTTWEVNHRKTVFAYLDDDAALALARHLEEGVRRRQTAGADAAGVETAEVETVRVET